MLILRRREGEWIEIDTGDGDDPIRILVAEVRGNSNDVNLGFETPPHMAVHRPESARYTRLKEKGQP